MERISREVVSVIQQERKDSGLDITDRIELQINTEDNFVIEAIKLHQTYIMNETLSLNVVLTDTKGKNQIMNKKIDLIINKLTNDS